MSGSAGTSDFEARDRLENNQLVFMGMPLNERDSTCPINLIDDSLFEENEFFFVKLEKASYNARLGKIDTVKVIIDGPNDFPVIEMTTPIMNVQENQGKLAGKQDYCAFRLLKDTLWLRLAKMSRF